MIEYSLMVKVDQVKVIEEDIYYGEVFLESFKEFITEQAKKLQGQLHSGNHPEGEIDQVLKIKMTLL